MTSTNISSDAGNSRTFFVNFNQDCTSIAVGSHTGYRLYSLSGGVDLLNQITAVTDDADICIVERLFGSSLVAVVSLTAPRKLKVCHFKKRSEICNYSYSNTILAVKLNRARLVVCLEESLYIHNIRDMKVLHTIRDTPPNPQGLCALSINNDSCYLAYPGSNTIGEVQIFDATNLQAKIMIQAHDSPLAAIAFNPTGGRIATASERGTVIRVFSVADGAKLYEFRRGMKRCVAISCLAFSTCGQYLATSSNTETVHVFKLELPGDIPRKSVDETGWIGFLSSYLPAQVTDVLNQGRAAMAAHLPVCGVKNVVGITTIQNQLRLLVACENGYLYVYNLDNNDAGDLVLLKQHRLDGVPDESAQQGKDKPDGRSDAQAITAKGEGSTGNSVLLALCSYAGVLKGNPADRMSESDKLREMAQATATPSLTEGGATLFLGDDAEYPPLTQRAD